MPTAPKPAVSSPPPPTAQEPETDVSSRLKRWIIGPPRDLGDRRIFKHLSLIAFLAWVGLGADGLSSSCYGPAEAFHSLGEHRYLAVALALATLATVFIIAACYSHIIEEFPSGGGGYLVASKLLGKHAGLVSGSALLVDYVLTITVSIAAAGDALFGLLSPEWAAWKLPAEFAAIGLLSLLNLRGVKESVMFLLPIFLLFLVTHALLIAGILILHAGEMPATGGRLLTEMKQGLADPSLGMWGMLVALLYAYSLGAGTYTGIEAVSNSMPVMREPRVITGQRTMRLMAISLSLTAGGLIVGYLLLGIAPVEGKTMNQSLTEAFVSGLWLPGWLGHPFVLATIVSEGALLVVAAQAGFIDGPRVLANMALDSWVPHGFANLSERLTTHNGVLLMAAAAVGALWYTGGNVGMLVLMYSINVFLTFSLSMVAMLRLWWLRTGDQNLRRKRLALFGAGAILCLTILVVTVIEKFFKGGWVTLAVTGGCVALCLAVSGYYRRVSASLRVLDEQLGNLEIKQEEPNRASPDPDAPTALILVGGYGGLGIHTMLNSLRFAPVNFKNMLFASVGAVDSGNFKGAEALDELRQHTERSLARYVDTAQRMGFASASQLSIGADVVDELERLCVEIAERYPRLTIFSGQLVFQRDTWYQRLLHNFTAFALQRRLQWRGLSMVILPTRVELRRGMMERSRDS
jgi:amino acid transporter